MTILYCRCIGEVRKLAAGGGHSAVLTDACSLKELCEFRLAECVTLSNAARIGDVASRTGADALARLCERLRYYFPFWASFCLIALLYGANASLLFIVSMSNMSVCSLDLQGTSSSWWWFRRSG